MNPAEVLAAAADRLDVLVSAVPAGPWGADDRCVEGLVGVSAWQKDVVFVGDHGEGGASTPHVAEYIAAMNPLVGKAMANLLRQEAENIRDFDEDHQRFVLDVFENSTIQVAPVLALARLIVGGES